MTDSTNTTKTTLGNVLGLKSKPKPIPLPSLMNEDQLLDETAAYAMAGMHRLREGKNTAEAKLAEVVAEFERLKADSLAEVMTQRHEYESKLAMARGDNESLRKQLSDTGAKLERFERWAYQLSTKCEDYEKFFSNSLNTLFDAGQHQTLALTSAINNATNSMHDAVKHTSEGMLKQLEHVVDDARAFLNDMKEKNGKGPAEFAPSPVPHIKPRMAMEPLDPESEKRLAEIISRRQPVENKPEVE